MKVFQIRASIILILSFSLIGSGILVPNSSAQDAQIPGWIKNVAGWWANGEISENEFLAGIEAGIDSKTAMSHADLIHTQKILSSEIKGLDNTWHNDKTSTSYNIKIDQYYTQNKRNCVSYQLKIKRQSKLNLQQLNACLNNQHNWIAIINDA
mgnify:CR=1 FL=1